MNISVLGCGRWGSCIAWYLDKIGNNVYSWGLSEAPDFQSLKKERKNEYLSYSPEMTVTDDLEAAVEHGEIIIISISSQNLRSFLQRINKYPLDGKIFVLCIDTSAKYCVDKENTKTMKEYIHKYRNSFIRLLGLQWKENIKRLCRLIFRMRNNRPFMW